MPSIWLLFLQGALLALPAALQPGPLQAVLAAQALRYGWRRALPAAAAPLVTDAFIITLMLLLLKQTPTWLLPMLRMLGGMFLIYLAIDMLRRWNQRPPTAQVDASGAQKSFLKAALMNLFNPNAYLFWGIVAGPILIDAWSTQAVLGIAFVLGFYLIFISSLGLFIFFVGSARDVSMNVHQALVLLSGAVLVFFGVWQIVAGLRQLIN